MARVVPKYAYCPACGTVSLLAILEKEVCRNCGKAAVPVPVSRSWQQWAGMGVILAGAVVLFLTPIQELWVRFAILAPFLAAGFALSTWGVRATKERVRRIATASKGAGGR